MQRLYELEQRLAAGDPVTDEYKLDQIKDKI